jgi:hypothetical protein
MLIRHLAACADGDYFERGIETAIMREGLRVKAIDISAFGCVEVDFAADLERAFSLGLTSVPSYEDAAAAQGAQTPHQMSRPSAAVGIVAGRPPES